MTNPGGPGDSNSPEHEAPPPDSVAGGHPDPTAVYGAPPYGSPASGAPTSGVPPYSTPAYGTPPYGTAPYVGPPSGPPYGQPGYGVPTGQVPYGQPQYYPPGAWGYGVQPRTNGFAIASLVCGLVGFLTGCSAILAIIFGFVARSQIKSRNEQGNGLAIAGIVLGFVVAVGYAALIVVFATVGTASNSP